MNKYKLKDIMFATNTCEFYFPFYCIDLDDRNYNFSYELSCYNKELYIKVCKAHKLGSFDSIPNYKGIVINGQFDRQPIQIQEYILYDLIRRTINFHHTPYYFTNEFLNTDFYIKSKLKIEKNL